MKPSLYGGALLTLCGSPKAHKERGAKGRSCKLPQASTSFHMGAVGACRCTRSTCKPLQAFPIGPLPPSPSQSCTPAIPPGFHQPDRRDLRNTCTPAIPPGFSQSFRKQGRKVSRRLVGNPSQEPRRFVWTNGFRANGVLMVPAQAGAPSAHARMRPYVRNRGKAEKAAPDRCRCAGRCPVGRAVLPPREIKRKEGAAPCQRERTRSPRLSTT